MTQDDKDKAVGLLRKALAEQGERLDGIEPRLHAYINGLADAPEHHNAYEILGGVKFMRLLRTYETDIEIFRDVIYKYEGVWAQDRRGVWMHVDGGLRHPGIQGPCYYRLQPFQVFVLASMFLFKVWINTEAEAGSRELLPTEKIMDVTN